MVATAAITNMPVSNGVITAGVLTGAITSLIPTASFLISTNVPFGTAIVASMAVGASAGMISGTVAAVKTGLAGTSAVISGAQGLITGCISGACTSSLICQICSQLTVQKGVIGKALLGFSEDKSTGLYTTFDCWKPILHDDSVEPSNGKLLRDIVADSRIKKVTIQNNSDGSISQFVLENIWNESFNIEFFYLMPMKQLVAHADKI
ncbi:unnamed protein product [Adineta steineri]|uniref:Uncharacterized protein n=1 Tax=Adineta steineri TaxID=433720 RepID=A0A814QV18_9BILA|nr:unnamed protein product [Adineta steineri]CAF4011354.1 unnamed protein product [Adineta steineri]